MNTSQLPTIGRGRSSDGRSGERATLVLARYRLHRPLGSGAFGTVWMARDERLDRDVAVKILPRERVVGGRFEREARAAARLTHPGIVTLYEAAVDDHGAYLVSELVRGQTLAQLLDAGRLSDRDVVAIAIALCDALIHAHAEGVVHRDVKPSNVLVPDRPATPAQPAKLTDFGVARVVGGDSLTRTGDVIGTAAYMAPEQAEGLPAGATADLYALALVVYEGLTGINPVRTGTAAQRARRLGAYLPPVRRQRRDLPRELGVGIDLALRPKPRERGTVEELRDALSGSLERLEDLPGVVAAPWRARSLRSAPERQPPPVRFDRPLPDTNAPAAHAADPVSEEPLVPERAGFPYPWHARPAYPWPARAIAGVASAFATGWISAHLLASSPAAPVIVALLAGALVTVLPRAGWLAVTAALTIAAASEQLPGGALAILIAGLIPVALLPFDGALWPLAVGAPGLGSIGVAGAWPAFAARAGTAWRRAALGAIGWCWLVLASPLSGKDVYLGRPQPSPSVAIWTRSLHVAAHDVLGPLFSSGAFAPAVVWALAAVVLPWLVRGRSPAADIVRAVVWAALVVASTVAVLNAVHYPGPIHAAVVGAAAGALVALVPSIVAAARFRRALGPEVRSMELP